MAKKKDPFKLEITDLRLLRIRRVLDWKIYFDYNGEHYIIISDTDEDDHTSFYKREIDNQGKVTVHCLCGTFRHSCADTFIRDVSKKHKGGLTYSNIDREFFVKQLVAFGFACGLFEKEYEDKEKRKAEIQTEINMLREKMQALERDWNTTSGHGSKCYVKNKEDK